MSATGSADVSKSPIRNEGQSLQNFSTLAPYGVTTNSSKARTGRNVTKATAIKAGTKRSVNIRKSPVQAK